MHDWIILAVLTLFTRRRVSDDTNVLLAAVAITLILGIPCAWVAGLSGSATGSMGVVLVAWEAVTAALTLIAGLSAMKDLRTRRRRDAGDPLDDEVESRATREHRAP